MGTQPSKVDRGQPGTDPGFIEAEIAVTRELWISVQHCGDRIASIDSDIPTANGEYGACTAVIRSGYVTAQYEYFFDNLRLVLGASFALPENRGGEWSE